MDRRINEVLTEYEYLRDRYKTELERSPQGSLICQRKGQQLQFLHSVNQDGKRIRKGINSKPELIKALAKKEYDRKAFRILINNVTALREAVDKMIPLDPDLILNTMTKAYSQLPEEYFFDRYSMIITEDIDDELLLKIRRHEEWWKRPYKEYWGYPEFKNKTTSRGQKVRSVSELLIAETLYKYSIPFHYEEELDAGGRTFAPDFTFEGSDYKCFYLDYFGMMDNEKYAKKNFLKLDDYYDVGLIPGENLIVAFNGNGIMNVKVIEGIIENEIIPRL